MSRLSRPGWVTLGLVLGAILVPATAVAVTATAVSITGNNHTASVSPAGQLRTTEMDASTDFHKFNFSSTGFNCIDMGAISTSRGAIVKQVNVSPDFVDSGHNTGAVRLYPNAGCTGDALFFTTWHSLDGASFGLGNGVPLPVGAHLGLHVDDGEASVDVYGYTVTGNAVPKSPAALRNTTTGSNRTLKHAG